MYCFTPRAYLPIASRSISSRSPPRSLFFSFSSSPPCDEASFLHSGINVSVWQLRHTGWEELSAQSLPLPADMSRHEHPQFYSFRLSLVVRRNVYHQRHTSDTSYASTICNLQFFRRAGHTSTRPGHQRFPHANRQHQICQQIQAVLTRSFRQARKHIRTHDTLITPHSALSARSVVLDFPRLPFHE